MVFTNNVMITMNAKKRHDKQKTLRPSYVEHHVPTHSWCVAETVNNKNIIGQTLAKALAK